VIGNLEASDLKEPAQKSRLIGCPQRRYGLECTHENLFGDVLGICHATNLGGYVAIHLRKCQLIQAVPGHDVETGRALDQRRDVLRPSR
jgi:hypothetical protein